MIFWPSVPLSGFPSPPSLRSFFSLVFSHPARLLFFPPFTGRRGFFSFCFLFCIFLPRQFFWSCRASDLFSPVAVSFLRMLLLGTVTTPPSRRPPPFFLSVEGAASLDLSFFPAAQLRSRWRMFPSVFHFRRGPPFFFFFFQTDAYSSPSVSGVFFSPCPFPLGRRVFFVFWPPVFSLARRVSRFHFSPPFPLSLSIAAGWSLFFSNSAPAPRKQTLVFSAPPLDFFPQPNRLFGFFFFPFLLYRRFGSLFFPLAPTLASLAFFPRLALPPLPPTWRGTFGPQTRLFFQIPPDFARGYPTLLTFFLFVFFLITPQMCASTSLLTPCVFRAIFLFFLLTLERFPFSLVPSFSRFLLQTKWVFLLHPRFRAFLISLPALLHVVIPRPRGVISPPFPFSRFFFSRQHCTLALSPSLFPFHTHVRRVQPVSTPLFFPSSPPLA